MLTITGLEEPEIIGVRVVEAKNRFVVDGYVQEQQNLFEDRYCSLVDLLCLNPLYWNRELS